MTSIISLKNRYEKEAYIYFDQSIRSIPKREDGTFIIDADTAHNNDLDAFRHAYVSARFTQEYGEHFADALGLANEVVSRNTSLERNMDLWNNSVGRQCGIDTQSGDDVGNAVKDALDRGGLIVTTNDSRRFSQHEDNQFENLLNLTKELSAELQSDLIDYCKDLLSPLIQTATTISTATQLIFNTLLSAEESFLPTRRVDPLTLDLDNDGIELVNVTSSTAFFDLDVIANEDGTYTSDGVKEQV
ncbi:MAG: hypothetical protein KGP29_05470, partial [Proteobacteria bacterium]|nr:hypothetical protein [Pseudomonadota bacterium]